jgi:hypothetical protein
MDGVPHATFDVEELQDCLRKRLARPRALAVTDVLADFLHVLTLPCDRRLWSLEFAFDESDGRIARLVAMFAERNVPAPTPDDLVGYEVQILLPVFLVPRAAEDVGAVLDVAEGATTVERLVASFLRALVDLGAYRAIERIIVRSAEVSSL